MQREGNEHEESERNVNWDVGEEQSGSWRDKSEGMRRRKDGE